MPNEQFTLLEATPQTIANLNRLKSIPPNLNLGATEMSNGNNSGIVANPPSAGNAVITGPFDVQLTYLEEDDGQGNMEIVPYVQVFDSSLQNATYAGYVYHQNQILNVMPGVLAPSQGWLYLDIDLITNTYTYDIGAYVPIYPLGTKHWCYALAYITVSNNVYSIRRVHVPGNIVMPMIDDGYQGYFKLSYAYENTTGQQTGKVTQTLRVYCSGGPLCIGGQIWTMTSRYVEGDLTYRLKDVILHYHIDLQLDTESLELILGTFNAANCNSTATDAYWLVGHASITYIIQQSHGVPQLFLIGDCES